MREIQPRILPPRMSFEQALKLGYTGRIELRPYLDWLRTLPCDTCGAPPPSDPSHVNSFKGLGTKSPDPFAIPECRRCHETYERASPQADQRLQRAAMYLLQALYEGRLIWRSEKWFSAEADEF
jgi:hypothetical protein